jgi:hypothetical protein
MRKSVAVEHFAEQVVLAFALEEKQAARLNVSDGATVGNALKA